MNRMQPAPGRSGLRCNPGVREVKPMIVRRRKPDDHQRTIRIAVGQRTISEQILEADRGPLDLERRIVKARKHADAPGGRCDEVLGILIDGPRAWLEPSREKLIERRIVSRRTLGLSSVDSQAAYEPRNLAPARGAPLQPAVAAAEETVRGEKTGEHPSRPVLVQECKRLAVKHTLRLEPPGSAISILNHRHCRGTWHRSELQSQDEHHQRSDDQRADDREDDERALRLREGPTTDKEPAHRKQHGN